MADKPARAMDFSGLEQPIGMGGHFTRVFKDDEWMNWRMVPFILIWAVFGLLLVVRPANHLLQRHMD